MIDISATDLLGQPSSRTAVGEASQTDVLAFKLDVAPIVIDDRSVSGYLSAISETAQVAKFPLSNYTHSERPYED